MIGWINPIVLSVAISFFVSQIIKSAILSIKKKRYAFESLYREYGGMPSTHTAVVSALVFSVYFSEGFSNLLFVSLVFAGIIIIDVVDSKWFFGKRDKILNELIKEHKRTNKDTLKNIKGEFGHTLLEVAVGILIAFVVSFIVFFV